MAKLEIVAVDQSTTPWEFEAPQGADTYLLPSLVFTTTGEFTSEVAASGSAKAFTFDTGSSYIASGDKAFSLADNGTEIFSIDHTAAAVTIGGKTGTAGAAIKLQPGSDTVEGVFLFSDVFNILPTMSSEAKSLFTFNSKTTDAAGNTAIQFNAYSGKVAARADIACTFANHNTNRVSTTTLGGLRTTAGIGMFGADSLSNHQFGASVQIDVTSAGIDNLGVAVDKGDATTVGIPITGHYFTAGQTVNITNTVNYNGVQLIDSVTDDEIVITDTYAAETFATGDLATLTATDKGGGDVGLPIRSHPFIAGDIVTIANTPTYNGTETIVSVTTNEIVVTALYTADLFATGDIVTRDLGSLVGFTENAAGAVNANDKSTYTGGLGSKAYTLTDIVNALKTCGLLDS
jgi:hypothetical protein